MNMPKLDKNQLHHKDYNAFQKVHDYLESIDYDPDSFINDLHTIEHPELIMYFVLAFLYDAFNVTDHPQLENIIYGRRSQYHNENQPILTKLHQFMDGVYHCDNMKIKEFTIRGLMQARKLLSPSFSGLVEEYNERIKCDKYMSRFEKNRKFFSEEFL